MSWSLLQSQSGDVAQSPSLTVSYTANASAGTKLIAYVIVFDSTTSATISSVKDGNGNSFTQKSSSPQGLGGGYYTNLYIYALDTPSADVGIKPSVKVTTSGGSGTPYITMLIEEVSGLAAETSSADGTFGTSASSNFSNPSTPSYSSTAANEFLVSVLAAGAGTFTAPSGYTLDSSSLNNNVNGDIGVAYKNSTNGSESGTWSISSGTNWAMTVGAFKLAPAFSLPVAQVTVASRLDSAAATPVLPSAQLTVTAYSPIRSKVVALPVATVNTRALAPRLPLFLPTARVGLQAPAVFVGTPAAPSGLKILFGSALGSGIYFPGTPGGAGGPGGPPAPGISSISGRGSGWEIAVLGAPDYATVLAVIPAKLITGMQFVQQLADAGSGTVTMNMDDIWWGPGWSFHLPGIDAASPSAFICAAPQAAAISAGDTFTWSGQSGTVFTVTEVVPAGISTGASPVAGSPAAATAERAAESLSFTGSQVVSSRPARASGSRVPCPQVVTGASGVTGAYVYFSPAVTGGDLVSGIVTSLSKAVLPNGQPASYLLDYEHVWQVRESGVARFEFLGETVTEQLADQQSEQRIVTVTGPGTLATLQWAAVMPPGFPEVVFKLDALKDSFSELNASGQYVLDTGLWNASSSSGVTLNPVGSARVTAVPGTTFLGSTAYDATESLISAQVSPIVSPDPAGNTLDNSQVTQFYIQDIVNGWYMLLGVSASSFYAKYSGPGGSSTQIIADIGTFNTAASGTQAYSYWQISESNGWFYVWTSSDGQIWSKQFAVQHTGWNPTYVAFYFTAAYDVSGTEYATVTSINSNVSTSSLGGPLYYNEPILATWLDQLTKAQARGTIPFVATGQLSSAHDSFGNSWSDSQSVQLQNGTDLLALLQAHAGMINADYIMLPGFRLQVGIPSAVGKITLGYDRSAQIVFADGHGATVHTRQRQRNQIQNLIAAINADGRVATADSTGSAAEWGQREGWIQAAVQVTEADISIVAEAAVEQAGAEVLSYTLQILPGLPGRKIFSDFLVGDWVGLERPDFSAIDTVRVIAISVQVGADGSETHELTLVSYVRWLQQQLQYIATKMGGGFLNAAGTTAIAAGANQLAPTIFSPTLSGLSDVSAAAPSGNAALVYDPVSGKWKPAGNAVDLTVAGVNGSTVLSGDGSGIQSNGSSFGQNVSAAGSLSSGGNANIGGTLAASTVQANGSLSGGSLSMSGASIDGSGNLVCASLTVDGNVVIHGTTTMYNTLGVNGAAYITGNLDAESTFQVGGVVTIQGTTTIFSDIGVHGNVNYTGSLNHV